MAGMPARSDAACDNTMSAIAENQRPSSANRFHLRAYLAGGGASTALVVGAVIAFLTIAALVAFNGLPFGKDGNRGAAQVPGASGGAPEAAAAVAAAAPGAVAATPAAATPVAPATGGAGSAAGGEDGASAPIATSPTAPGAFPTQEGSGLPGTSPAPPGAASGGGAVGETVGGVEQTAGNLGLDLPLTETTTGITGTVDQALEQTLNDVGGRLGSPGLGERVGSEVNGLTDKLLP
jgi:hypothetical protein